jgi:hypothetical protein
MDQNLQRLVSELRKETCPQAVLDRVARRLSTTAHAPNRFRYGLAGVVLGLVLLCGVAVWQWQARDEAHEQTKLANGRSLESTRIAKETEWALGYIGSVLRDASSHSGRIVLKEAGPPLRDSLQKAKDKITDHTQL